jgi:hypothetical protein
MLSFQLKPDAFGSSAVTVFLKDNGETARGGADQSSTETFTITVNSVNDAPHVDPVSDVSIAGKQPTNRCQSYRDPSRKRRGQSATRDRSFFK